MIKQEKTVSISGSLRYGWNTFKKHGWFLAGSFLATLLISFIAGNVGGSSLFGQMVGNIVSIVVSILIALGWTTVTLKFVKSETVSWKDFYTNYKLFWKYAGASIVYGLIVCGGLILLIVPGIIWALKYKMFSYLVVEKKMGIKAALRESAHITKGARWSLLGFIIVMGLINVVGFLALGVGLVITAPIVMIANAYIYKSLKEQTQ